MALNNVKARRTLLPLAARTAQTVATNPDNPDRDSVGARLYLNVTAASGTGGLKCIIRGYDNVSGLPVNITAGGALVTATGTYCYEMYPGMPAAIAGGVLERSGSVLPMDWDVLVTVGDASSYTYSLSAEVLK